jgi:hypothetical protein
MTPGFRRAVTIVVLVALIGSVFVAAIGSL